MELIMQPTFSTCGQACIAMIAGKNVEEVIRDMKTDGATSIGQLIGILDFYGIGHAERNKRISKKNPVPYKYSILTVHTNAGYTHWTLLYDNKYYGILELLHKEDEQEMNIPKVLRDGKVDGLIFMGQMDERYIQKMVSQSELPIFFLDTYKPSIALDTVISDGYYGTYLLTDYLIRYGHKKIGFVGNVEATDSIADRFWGYRKALRENHIEFESKWEISDRSKYGKTGDKILYGRSDLEAYVCNCDYTAQIVIQDLEERGYDVPEDISVVGFDDFLPVGRGMEEDRITSYSVNMERMAEACVESLIKN